jgi:FG-GAP-like repeat
VPTGFGDFDLDGKDDAFLVRQDLGGGNAQWTYSKGAAAPYQNLGIGPGAATRIGDFNGDGRSDVFAAKARGDGLYQWQYWSGGTGNPINLAIGGPVVGGQMKFGDFNGDRKTDVFTVHCD